MEVASIYKQFHSELLGYVKSKIRSREDAIAGMKEAMKRMVEGHPWSPTEMAEVASRYDFKPVTAET